MTLGNASPPKGQAPIATGQATVTTNTATAMGSIQVLGGSVQTFRVITDGNDTAGTEGHGFLHILTARRTSAGVTSIVASTALASHRDRGGSAVTFAVVGNAVQVNFTGITGRTISAGFRAYLEDTR